MPGRLEHESPDWASFAGAPRQQVQRANHVHLMGATWIHVEGVDAGQRMHHGVDVDRSHELSDQRVTDVELEIVGASQVITRLAGIDADNLAHAGVFHQALHEEGSPPAGDAGNENAPFLSGHLQLSLALEIMRGRWAWLRQAFYPAFTLHSFVARRTLLEKIPTCRKKSHERKPRFPLISVQYVRLMTSRSMCATAADTLSRRGDFAVRSAHSSWRSSE